MSRIPVAITHLMTRMFPTVLQRCLFMKNVESICIRMDWNYVCVVVRMWVNIFAWSVILWNTESHISSDWRNSDLPLQRAFCSPLNAEWCFLRCIFLMQHNNQLQSTPAIQLCFRQSFGLCVCFSNPAFSLFLFGKERTEYENTDCPNMSTMVALDTEVEIKPQSKKA